MRHFVRSPPEPGLETDDLMNHHCTAVAGCHGEALHTTQQLVLVERIVSTTILWKSIKRTAVAFGLRVTFRSWSRSPVAA